MSGADPRPDRGDAAHQRQLEEYQRAVERGRPGDVGEPEQCLRYRLELWARRQGTGHKE